MGYLDDAGLRQVMNHVSGELNARRPTIPVTKEEYDALSQDDKNKDVFYAITDDSSSSGGGSSSSSSSIPSGVIVSWYGTIDNVPEGWAICDGQNGTPDLRGKFILGVSSNYYFGQTGGEETHTLTINEMPSHDHSYNFGKGTDKFVTSSSTSYPSLFTGFSAVNSGRAGNSKSHNNMPPFYALYYIMKL